MPKPLVPLTPVQTDYFVNVVCKAVKRRGRFVFRNLCASDPAHWHQVFWSDFYADCRATAFLDFRHVITNQNTRWTPGTIAEYACKQVSAGRVIYSGVSRSIDDRPEFISGRKKPRNAAQRVQYDDVADSLADPLSDPSAIVAYRLDYRQWLRNLLAVLRRTVRAVLARGGNGEDATVARSLGISSG
jgi:hypothetical protein